MLNDHYKTSFFKKQPLFIREIACKLVKIFYPPHKLRFFLLFFLLLGVLPFLNLTTFWSILPQICHLDHKINVSYEEKLIL